MEDYYRLFVVGVGTGREHKASLQRVVTSVDMKVEDVDQATPRQLTTCQQVATTQGGTTNKVAKESQQLRKFWIKCGAWYLAIGAGALRSCAIPNKRTNWGTSINLWEWEQTCVSWV
eukprot:COSAG05_NODE_611_length_8359_cov_5.328935_4_plen_117_part_00